MRTGSVCNKVWALASDPMCAAASCQLHGAVSRTLYAAKERSETRAHPLKPIWLLGRPAHHLSQLPSPSSQHPKQAQASRCPATCSLSALGSDAPVCRSFLPAARGRVQHRGPAAGAERGQHVCRHHHGRGRVRDPRGLQGTPWVLQPWSSLTGALGLNNQADQGAREPGSLPSRSCCMLCSRVQRADRARDNPYRLRVGTNMPARK